MLSPPFSYPYCNSLGVGATYLLLLPITRNFSSFFLPNNITTYAQSIHSLLGQKLENMLIYKKCYATIKFRVSLNASKYWWKKIKKNCVNFFYRTDMILNGSVSITSVVSWIGGLRQVYRECKDAMRHVIRLAGCRQPVTVPARDCCSGSASVPRRTVNRPSNKRCFLSYSAVKCLDLFIWFLWSQGSIWFFRFRENKCSG